MSKTAQRKYVAYQQGYEDGSLGYGFRWKRHPFMECYKSGYADGCAKRNQAIPKHRAASTLVTMACGFALGLLFAITVAGFLAA